MAQDNNNGIDFALIKKRKQTSARFETVTSGFSIELTLLIWKHILTTNFTLDEIVFLLKTGSPLNDLIISLLSENRLFVDINESGLNCIRFDNIKGYILGDSPLIFQLIRHMPDPRSKPFCEARATDRVFYLYEPLGTSAMLKTHELIRALVALSKMINLHILRSEHDLEFLRAMEFIPRITSTGISVFSLQQGELASSKLHFPLLTGLQSLELRFTTFSMTEGKFPIYLKYIETIPNLKKLLLNFFVPLNSAGPNTSKHVRDFCIKNKKRFKSEVSYIGFTLYDEDPPENSIAELMKISPFVTKLKITINTTKDINFDFLDKLPQLDSFEFKYSKPDERQVSKKIMDNLRTLKNYNFRRFSKLKNLELEGFLLSKEFFDSVPDTVSHLKIHDSPLTKTVGSGQNKFKFPKNLKDFHFYSSHDEVYKYPIIANSDELYSLMNVTVKSITGGYAFYNIDGKEPLRYIPMHFLNSLPNSVRNFEYVTDTSKGVVGWNLMDFSSLKQVENLIIESVFASDVFNLSSIPHNLRYLELALKPQSFSGRLMCENLRELKIGIRKLAKTRGGFDISSFLNNFLSNSSKNLDRLVIALGDNNLKANGKDLDLSTFKLREIGDITFNFENMSSYSVRLTFNQIPLSLHKIELNFTLTDGTMDMDFSNLDFNSFAFQGPPEEYFPEIVVKKKNSNVKNCRFVCGTGEELKLTVGES